jgi:hypothetical protein
MSESPEQPQTTQTQSQSESQTQSQTYSVKVYYVTHNDDFSSKHLQPVIIRYIGRIYNIFMKQRIGRPDAYYIINDKTYVKLWRDYKGHLLTFISDKSPSPMFFVNNADIIRVEENIIYEYDTRKLLCSSKTIILKGFDIIKALDEVKPELLPPVFALLCERLL